MAGFLVVDGGGGGDAGPRLGPTQNEFTSVAARNSYAAANASWLAQYDADRLLMVRVVTGTGTTYYSRPASPSGTSDWDNVTPVITGPAGSVTSLASVSTGHIPYKDGADSLADSGAQILSGGDMLLPLDVGLEKEIDFGDIATLTEANGGLRFKNLQSSAGDVDLIGAVVPSTGASSRPRQNYLQGSEADFAAQSIETETITDNPLTYTYTATDDHQVNKIIFRSSSSAAIPNFALRIRYNTSPNAVLKYWPSKAKWLTGDGDAVTPSGGNDEITIDFSDSPIEVLQGDVLEFQIVAYVVNLLGNTSDVPYMRFRVRDTEYRDLAWLSDVGALIDDASIATDKVRSAENTAQKNSEALKFNARNSQTTAMTAGDIVSVVGGDTFQSGNVPHLELARDLGLATQFLLPVGILTEDMPTNTTKEQVVLHKGHATVTIPGQDSLPLDTPIYVTRTGTGSNEKWEFTHTATGTNTHFVGRIHNDAGTNQYYAWVDFGLVWADAGLSTGGSTLDVLLNGTEVLADAADINFVGDHITTNVTGSQVDVNIDPGCFNLTNGSGSTMTPGAPAYIGSDNGSEEALAINPSGSVNNYPTLWAAETIADNASGKYVSQGAIENVTNINVSASTEALAPIAANTALQWNPGAGKFTTLTVNANFVRVGEVYASRYVLDETTFFDADLALGSIGISTAAAANAARNSTIVVKGSFSASANLQIPALGSGQAYETPFLVGDRIAFTNNVVGENLTITQQSGGTFQNIGGTGITSYQVTTGNSVIIERLAGNIWRVVAEDSGIVESDIVVSIHRLENNRDSRQDSRLTTVEANITSLEDVNNVSIRSAFRGLETEATGDDTVVISSGECGSDNGIAHINVTSDITLTMSSSTLDTGSEAASTWYYIWIFKETSGNNVTARYSISATNPTVPSGYNGGKRLVGMVRNNSSSNFYQFWTRGAGKDKIYTYKTEFLTLNNQTVTNRTSYFVTDRVPQLPSGNYAVFAATFEYGGTANFLIYQADENSTAIFAPAGGELVTVPLFVTDSAGQIHLDSTGTTGGIYMKVQGFYMGL